MEGLVNYNNYQPKYQNFTYSNPISTTTSSSSISSPLLVTKESLKEQFLNQPPLFSTPKPGFSASSSFSPSPLPVPKDVNYSTSPSPSSSSSSTPQEYSTYVPNDSIKKIKKNYIGNNNIYSSNNSSINNINTYNRIKKNKHPLPPGFFRQQFIFRSFIEGNLVLSDTHFVFQYYSIMIHVLRMGDYYLHRDPANKFYDDIFDCVFSMYYDLKISQESFITSLVLMDKLINSSKLIICSDTIVDVMIAVVSISTKFNDIKHNIGVYCSKLDTSTWLVNQNEIFILQALDYKLLVQPLEFKKYTQLMDTYKPIASVDATPTNDNSTTAASSATVANFAIIANSATIANSSTIANSATIANSVTTTIKQIPLQEDSSIDSSKCIGKRKRNQEEPQPLCEDEVQDNETFKYSRSDECEAVELILSLSNYNFTSSHSSTTTTTTTTNYLNQQDGYITNYSSKSYSDIYNARTNNSTNNISF